MHKVLLFTPLPVALLLLSGCDGGGMLKDPKQIAAIAVDPATYPNSDGVYLTIETIHGQTPAGTHDIQHEAYRILRESGVKRARRTIDYDTSERVEIEAARTILPGGVVVEVPPGAVLTEKDKLGFNQRKVVVFPQAAVGCTLDLQYSVRWDAPAMYSGSWLTSRWIPLLEDDPVVSRTVIARYPAATLRTFLAPNVQQKIDERQYLRTDGTSEVQYTLKLSNLTGLNEEVRTPAAEDALLFPQALVSNFSDWDKVAWFEGVEYWELQKTDDAFNAAVDQIVAGASTDEEKVRRLFTHLSRKIRWQETAPASTYLKDFYKPVPRAPLEILPSGFASPEERTRLLLAMLDRAGIKAFAAYVRRGTARALPQQVPLHDKVFKTRIVAIEEGGGYRFVDPSTRYASQGYLPADVQGHTVFVITGRQSGKFAKVPVSPLTDTVWDEKQQIALDASGAASVQTDLLLSGEYALAERDALATAPMSDWKGHFQRTGETVASADAPNLDEPEEPLRVSLRSTRPAFTASKGHALSVAPVITLPDYASLPLGRPRHLPLQLDFAYIRQFHGSLTAPKGWKVKSVPKNQRIEKAYGIASAQYAYTGTTATYEIGYSQAVFQLKAEGYADFVEHWKTIQAALAEPIVFEKP